MYSQLLHLSEKNRVVCFVGAGGKTSLMKALAEEYAQRGKRVIVTTTTQLAREEGFRKDCKDDHVVIVDKNSTFMCVKDRIEEIFAERKWALVVSEDPVKRKFCRPFVENVENDLLSTIKDWCDILLIEADGSRRMPFKLTGEKEPVIPSFADTLIGVLGSSALGQSFEEACFRSELCKTVLGKDKKQPITWQDYVKVYSSDQGLYKYAGGRSYRAFLNQADLLPDDEIPLRIQRELEQTNCFRKYESTAFISTSMAQQNSSCREKYESEGKKSYFSWGSICSVKEQEMAFILLAAGNSLRFEGNKLFYEIGDQPMFVLALERLINAAEALGMSLGRITIVTQYPEIAEYAEQQGVRVVCNPHPERGISSSLKIALRENIAAEACLFSVADQPLLRPETIEKLVREFRESPKHAASLKAGSQAGNPCIFSKKYYRDLLALSGDRGGRRILRAHPEDIHFTEADPEELEDMDYAPDNRGNCSAFTSRYEE